MRTVVNNWVAPFRPVSYSETAQKTARLEARITADQKGLIELAAAYEGRTVSDFVVDTVQEAAKAVIREHEVLPLDGSQSRAFVETLILVNFLQYTESTSEGSIRKRFSWVTDLTITPDNASHLVRGGRSRWKIENETFNTLKNQGYQFGHNFGHGQQNLSTIFAMSMVSTHLEGLFKLVRMAFYFHRWTGDCSGVM